MRVRIVHASISENGTVNGVAGDQTGGEVCERDLYNRGWDLIYRPITSELALRLSGYAREIAANDNIGYSQDDRYSLLDRMEQYHDFCLIKTPCNCDCSSLITAICQRCGIDISEYMTTRTEDAALTQSGYFTRYTYEADKILVGDILHADGHTAIVVSVEGGAEVGPDTYADFYARDYAGEYITTDICNVRIKGRLDARILTVIGEGQTVTNYGYYDKDSRGVIWLYVKLGYKTGFISSKILARKGNME